MESGVIEIERNEGVVLDVLKNGAFVLSVDADLGCLREVVDLDLLAQNGDLSYKPILIHFVELDVKL